MNPTFTVHFNHASSLRAETQEEALKLVELEMGPTKWEHAIAIYTGFGTCFYLNQFDADHDEDGSRAYASIAEDFNA